MKLLVIGIILLLSILALLVGASVMLLRFACLRKEPENSGEIGGSWKPFEAELRADQKWLKDHESKAITIEAYDKTKLAAHLVLTENAKGTIIAFHGYRSNYDVDFAPHVKFFTSLGYNVLLPTMRSHGESGGKYITFGVKERYDCLSWTQYISERFGKEHIIFTAGISMGAATVLMASGLKLPKNVRGIIADCGFTSPWAICCRVAKRALKLPAFPLLYTTDLISRLVAGFSFREYSTLDAMKTNRLPILFIHGDKDDFVPMYMTEENYAACKSEKKFVIIKDSPHAVNYYNGKEIYEKECAEFINNHS